ncbi:MAG: chemotaxis protein CheW [Eubacteriales bacterium]
MEKNEREQIMKQFIIINFGQEHFGIDIKFVQNIIRMQSITRVPKAPSYLKGVINLRGDIIPVISLREKFGLNTDEITNSTRIIIVDLEQNPMGFIVDEVREVVQIPEDSIQKSIYDAKDEKSAFLSSVGKNGDELISILNLDTIINGNKSDSDEEEESNNN